MLDLVKNFIKVTVSTGYTSTDTSIVLNSGDGAKLPTAPFNLIWYNATDYPDVQSDPDKEIVRVTGIDNDTLTVERGQEGTTAVNHNIAGKTYKMIQSITEKMIDDINNHIVSTANPHNVTKAQVGLDNVENIKNNYEATAPPTVNDDVSTGYTGGSRWLDTTTNKEYVCLGNAIGAAKWIETTKVGFASGFATVVGTSQSIPATTTTTIAFNTEEFDGLNEYDTSSYRFTAASAGRYLFTIDLDFRFTAADTSNYIYLMLYKNGTGEQLTLTYSADTNDHTAHLTYNTELAAGDYIEAVIYAATAGTVGTYSRFNGQRVY